MDSHAHALVPDVVALAEVVGAACAGEGYGPRIVAIPISFTYLGKLATP